MLRSSHLFALAVVLLTSSQNSAQQSDPPYPSKPIRIIVSAPAGGGVDTAARIVAEKLQQKFGQRVTVENHGGQSGNIGAEAVAAAAPDGYTCSLPIRRH